ncbi:hypothetical protein [Arthrobacter sp. UYEF36]|uniref:hypothetical protein n=1 Tax=Arthrobacter sp. UYEF36 TaxID=1756366 RepID=UPI003396FE4E
MTLPPLWSGALSSVGPDAVAVAVAVAVADAGIGTGATAAAGLFGAAEGQGPLPARRGRRARV